MNFDTQAQATLSEAIVASAFSRRAWSAWEAPVQLQVQTLLTDTCAVGLAGAHADGLDALRRVVAGWGGVSEASVIGSELRLPSGSAVLINSAAVHALDYDDFLEEGGLHAMTVVFPVAFALAEKCGVKDGRILLAAIAAGLDVSARLSVAARRKDMDPGWLPASIFGGVGAVIAGALIADLAVDQAVSAIGLFYGQAGGNRQALRDGTLAKRMQPAFAARNAVLSIELAKHGINGPSRALDGPYGLFPLYVNSPAPASDSWDAGNGEAVLMYRLKPYPCCAASHPAIEAALMLRGGLKSNEIRHIRVSLASRPFRLVGGDFAIRANPQVDAQFSAAYAVALAFQTGEVALEGFLAENVLANSAVQELASRVETVMQEGTDHLGAWEAESSVEVTMADGEVRREVVRGMDVSASEFLSRKVKQCLRFAGMGDPSASDHLLTISAKLGDGDDLTGLSAVLRRDLHRR